MGRVGRHQLLQVTDGVVVVALHPDLLSQAVVEDYLNHWHGAGCGRGRGYGWQHIKPNTIACGHTRYCAIPLALFWYF